MRKTTILALFLLPGIILLAPLPTQAKRLVRQTNDQLHFRIDLPKAWKDGDVDPQAGYAQWVIDSHGGKLTIHYEEEPKSLENIQKDVAWAGKIRNWRLVRTRNTRMKGKSALAMLFDVPGEGITARQLFYFINTEKGRYILHFGASKKRFKRRLFRKIATRFKALAPPAKPVAAAPADPVPSETKTQAEGS
jgi:hypothetical protein